MRRALASLGLAAAAACQSVAPMSTHPAPVAPAAVVALAAPCEAARHEIDFVLKAAFEAASAGRAGDFGACEADVFAALAACPEAGLPDPELAVYVGQLLEDLEALAELAAGGGADGVDVQAADLEEAPPEPEPVSSEQVVAEQEKAREAAYDLPVVVNAEVASLIEFYSGPYRERFSLAMERAGRFLPFIREELRKARLPADLAYLPFVESAFNPHARSRARAQGLWQFMSGTARLYELRCDRMVDERNDPFLATSAAIAHLADLHAMFGRWELALAAYNSGAGRIRQAMRRASGATDDFWRLRRHLPRETRNYLPAFWAVLVIVKNPIAYGFAPILERPECLGRITVAGALDLEVLAEHARVDVALLADINPALTYRATPVKGSYRLAVPCGEEERYAAVLASIPRSERVRSFMHVVEKGDTLAAIARRYGSSAETIQAANGIRDPRSLRIGQSLIVPSGPRGGTRPPAASAAAARPTSSMAQRTSARPERYRVRSGDSLYSIARRFGVSVERLKALNGLSGNLIKPGQWLRLV